MRSRRITTRALALVLLAVLAILTLRRALRAPPPLTTVQPAPSASVNGDAGPDAGADVAGAGADAGGPRCLSEAMANLEPHERWLARFDGAPAADTQPPPKLGVLGDLPALPRSQLAFVRSDQIFAVDLPGGAERALTHGARDSNPRWSPRGTHLAFVREDHHDGFVYLVRADGTDLRRLSAVPLYLGITFSADGRYLAFPAADHDVIIHDLDTDAEQRLSTPDRVDVGPVFEASGPRLAMTVFGDDSAILVADAATGRMEQHDLPARHRIYSIAFVPGALLIAMSMSTDPGDATSIWRLALDHKKKLDLEHMPFPMVGAGVELSPAPGGSRIAFVNNSQAREQIDLPDGYTGIQLGDWFRRQIYFYDRRHPQQDSLVGAFPQPRFSTTSPAWAPDGRHLAFTLALLNNANDQGDAARGIVAVDTKSPALALSYVACGSDPTWGPPVPAPPGVER